MTSAKRLTTRPAVLAAAAVGLAVLVVAGFVWWGRPPRMGGDPEAFKTVDALFTAVTARDTKLLGQCQQRLQALKDAGKLPRDASDYLDRVIREARAGSWQAAAETLYGFMKVQRREGTETPGPRRRKDVSGQGAKASRPVARDHLGFRV